MLIAPEGPFSPFQKRGFVVPGVDVTDVIRFEMETLTWEELLKQTLITRRPLPSGAGPCPANGEKVDGL
jgi:hypothetical protein